MKKIVVVLVLSILAHQSVADQQAIRAFDTTWRAAKCSTFARVVSAGNKKYRDEWIEETIRLDEVVRQAGRFVVRSIWDYEVDGITLFKGAPFCTVELARNFTEAREREIGYEFMSGWVTGTTSQRCSRAASNDLTELHALPTQSLSQAEHDAWQRERADFAYQLWQESSCRSVQFP